MVESEALEPGAVRLEKRPDGIGVLVFDTPKSRVNVLSSRFFEAFQAALDQALADPEIEACVLASAKADNFIAGADFKEFLEISDALAAERLSQVGHQLLDRIAGSSKPFVAAIDGPALGGGYEVALACHYLIASDSPRTVVGLPEVTLGLLPAAGGCQRLARRIGLPAALKLILSGDRVRPGKALELGMIDAVTSPGGIVDTAAAAAARLAQGSLGRRHRISRADRLLTFTPLRSLPLATARKEVRKRTRGLYPAPRLILDAVAAGLARGVASGYQSEVRGFGQLVASDASKHMIRLFMAMNDKKPLDAAPPRPVGQLAVIGAGFMGEGIASVSLGQVPVFVKDISADMLSRCASNIAASLDKRVKSGALTHLDRDRQWSRLHLTSRTGDLERADLVIEAVFEKLDLKQRVLAEIEEVIRPDAGFASNTSALPIARIAEHARHPGRVLGMHYFSPVPKMPLLEIVVTDRTEPWAIATARKFGMAQGKTCIVVHDGPGFYTSRILAPYLGEAIALLAEGARTADVDSAALDFGFPVGPIALLDEVGIDVGAHVSRDLAQAFADRLGDANHSADLLMKLVDAGYLGRKNGRGFYRYPPAGSKARKTVNPDLYAFFGGPERKTLDRKEMADRLAFVMMNEAVHCLAEGVLASPADGDVGAILGLGFPPFTGGPFRYIDAMGPQSAVRRMTDLASRHGARFKPAHLLVDVASGGRHFHDDGSVRGALRP